MRSVTCKKAHELLAYNSDTGVLKWRVKSGRVEAGDQANAIRSDGYIQVGICGKRYMAHRLIWFMVTGRWPRQSIDHRDGNRTNNRWANLRDVSPRVNSQNMHRPHKDNAHGFLGVSFIRGRKQKPFRSEIRDQQGLPISLGTFAEPETAHIMYCFAKLFYHGGAA